jgi:hypothetical protein
MYATDGHYGFMTANVKIGVYVGQDNPGPGVAWTLQRRRPHAGLYSLGDATTEGQTAPLDPYDPDRRAKLWFWRDDRFTED